ncbi:MAG: hypothetical protein HGB18_01000 [Candidatus Moranbacteria bacterium]|nr:hypothetical protein [Candidatus Moranbacteria bacterium]
MIPRKFMERVREYWESFRVGSWFLGTGSAVLVLLVIGLLSCYVAPRSWALTSFVSDRLPFPLATVGASPAASFRSVAEDLASVRRFYESQDFSSVGLRVDFTTEDGKKRLMVREREIINRAIENEAIRRIARREGIAISDDEVEKAVSDQLNTEGNDVQDVERRLKTLYGWNISEFTGKVVKPALYEEELRKRFESDTSRFSDARAKAENAEKRLRDGRDFADVAEEFSDGRTARDGGDMGWFSYDDLDVSLRDAAGNQAVGKPGDVVESGLGFHILLVKDRKAESGKDLVQLAQIFVPKQTFGDWLADEMRMMPVRVLSPSYEWDRDAARVEFRDRSMREFEANLARNSEGDASVIF